MTAPDLSSWVSPDAPKGWAPLAFDSKPELARWHDVKNGRLPAAWKATTFHEADKKVNAGVQYVQDQLDEWQLPKTTLTRKKGDCEDFALMKRAVLLNSEVPESRLALLLVFDRLSRRNHAVLWVQCDAHGGHILDNLNSLTLPVAQVKDYTPLLAFQGDHAWAYGRKR